MSALADVIVGNPEDVARVPTLRMGIVTATGPLLVRVGAAATAQACRALASYVPTVGDAVSVLVLSGDRLVVGRSDPSGGTGPDLTQFVRKTGDNMTGGLNITVGAGGQVLGFAPGGAYMAWYGADTARTGYMQGNDANGLTINTDRGPLALYSAAGYADFGGRVRVGVPTKYGSNYGGLTWNSGDYLIMSDGGNTFVSSPSGSGGVFIRGGANGGQQLYIDPNGNHTVTGNLGVTGRVYAGSYGFQGGDGDTWADNVADGYWRFVCNGVTAFQISQPTASISVEAAGGYTGGLRLYSIGNSDHAIRYASSWGGVEINSYAGVKIYLTATGQPFDFGQDGVARDNYGWTTYSSLALKENVEELTAARALEMVTGLRPVTYDMRDGTRQDEIGLIAEWTQDVAPYAVAAETEHTGPAIDYGRLAPLIIRALQDVIERLARVEHRAQEETA